MIQTHSYIESITDSKEEAAELELKADLLIALQTYFHNMNWNKWHIVENLEVTESYAEWLRSKRLDLLELHDLTVMLWKVNEYALNNKGA